MFKATIHGHKFEMSMQNNNSGYFSVEHDNKEPQVYHFVLKVVVNEERVFNDSIIAFFMKIDNKKAVQQLVTKRCGNDKKAIEFFYKEYNLVSVI